MGYGHDVCKIGEKMLNIARTSACTGCHACSTVCPVSAICMRTNKEGFLYPSIDDETCISCGKCESVCPVLHPPALHEGTPRAYACRNLNEKIRLQSSSGGVFTLLAERVIADNGVVFGARFTEDFSVIHDWVDTAEELAGFRGSKYVQSKIGTAYRDCQNILREERTVLFTGTPCQIGGLKTFLGKEYNNLICVDFICHGVPSPALWKKYVTEQETQAASQVVRTAFRRKDCGWKRFSLAFTFENASEYRATLDKDPYMLLFLRNVCLRPSCYECSFKTLNRASDITLADFWGIQNVMPDMDDDTGTSLVLVHSDVGMKLIAALSGLEAREVPAVDSVQSNQSMISSVERPVKRDTFFIDMDSMDFKKLLQKYTTDSVTKKIIILMHSILSKLRKLKGPF